MIYFSVQVYEVVKEAWKSKSAIAELPDQDDMPIPLPDYMEVGILLVFYEVHRKRNQDLKCVILALVSSCGCVVVVLA